MNDVTNIEAIAKRALEGEWEEGDISALARHVLASPSLRARVEGLTSPTAAMRTKDRTEEDSVFADGYERCRADVLALLVPPSQAICCDACWKPATCTGESGPLCDEHCGHDGAGEESCSPIKQHGTGEEEPMTEEWLRGVGFELSRTRMRHGYVPFYLGDVYATHIVAGDYDGWEIAIWDKFAVFYAMPHIKTRRQLLNLLTALGISPQATPQ